MRSYVNHDKIAVILCLLERFTSLLVNPEIKSQKAANKTLPNILIADFIKLIEMRITS